MGKADRPRRLTRAEKIEQSRIEAAELKRFQAKPWWPIKAHTEEEAIKLIVGRINDLATLEAMLADEHPIKDFQTLGKVTEARTFIESIPPDYMEKAKASIERESQRLTELNENGFLSKSMMEASERGHQNFG